MTITKEGGSEIMGQSEDIAGMHATVRERLQSAIVVRHVYKRGFS